VELATEKLKDITIITLPCDSLDTGNSVTVKELLNPIVATNAKLIMDLHEVNFMDSTGCGVILSCWKTIKEKGGDLKLCGFHKRVSALFVLLRLDHVYDIYVSRGDALESFIE